MKANRFSPHHLSLVALTAFLLSASSLQAQTFSGANTLGESPAGLEAAVYPLTNLPSTIKVLFNNPTGGTVRIVIRDEKQKIWYEEFSPVALYRRRFDLSPLPQGKYTVDLIKNKEHFAQDFSIATPSATRIALEMPPSRLNPEKTMPGKLAISQ